MNRGHTPHRMCIGCRSVRPKKELLRLVMRMDSSVTVDEAQRAPGRGVYLCPLMDCFEKALKKKDLDACLDRASLVEEVNSLCDVHTRSDTEVQ
jgi:predicted RNA-binding protein YlxR (DUF448 family)